MKTILDNQSLKPRLYYKVKIWSRRFGWLIAQKNRAVLFATTIPSRFQPAVLEGLSLTRCVPYIAEWRVPLRMVKMIHAATAFPTREEYYEAVNRYPKTRVWPHGADHYVRIAMLLWNQGKIHQPRLEGKDAHWTVDGENWFIGNEIITDADLPERIAKLNRFR